jgi:hypothetical protein
MPFHPHLLPLSADQRAPANPNTRKTCPTDTFYSYKEIFAQKLDSDYT